MTRITRRTAIAAIASVPATVGAGAALALSSSIPTANAASLPATSPDAALLDLGRELYTLDQQYRDALVRCNAAVSRYNAIYDAPGGLGSRRKKAFPRGIPAPVAFREPGQTIEQRVAELPADHWAVREWRAEEEWRRDEKALADETGCSKADAEFDCIHEACSDVVRRIAEMTATTMAGLRVKARAVQWCYGSDEIVFGSGETTDVRLAASIVRDLLGGREQ